MKHKKRVYMGLYSIQALFSDTHEFLDVNLILVHFFFHLSSFSFTLFETFQLYFVLEVVFCQTICFFVVFYVWSILFLFCMHFCLRSVANYLAWYSVYFF